MFTVDEPAGPDGSSRRRRAAERRRLHPLRTALVLGGGSDIGSAIVSALAEQGLRRCVLAGRDPEASAEALRRTIGPEVEVRAERWDALDIADHERFVTSMFGAHGPIDLVICAVGLLGHHAGLAMGPEQIDLMARSNFVGPAAVLSAIAPALVQQGHGTVVVLSSVAAARARRSNYVYGSAKAGLDAFAQGLGDALADTPVAVIVARPGFVRSKMTVGLDPAPFSRTPDEVAAVLVRAINAEHSRIVWIPGVLGLILGLLRLAPQRIWRKVSGDR